MKRTITFVILMTIAVCAGAQSTDVKNYSGKMYLKEIADVSTPRYVSFEDHAILSTELTVPTTKVIPVILDFERDTIKVGEDAYCFKVTDLKKYSKADGWTVVIYMEEKSGMKMELVWCEYGAPYLNLVHRNDDVIAIEKIILSPVPEAVSPEEAWRRLLGM